MRIDLDIDLCQRAGGDVDLRALGRCPGEAAGGSGIRRQGDAAGIGCAVAPERFRQLLVLKGGGHAVDAGRKLGETRHGAGHVAVLRAPHRRRRYQDRHARLDPLTLRRRNVHQHVQALLARPDAEYGLPGLQDRAGLRLDIGDHTGDRRPQAPGLHHGLDLLHVPLCRHEVDLRLGELRPELRLATQFGSLDLVAPAHHDEQVAARVIHALLAQVGLVLREQSLFDENKVAATALPGVLQQVACALLERLQVHPPPGEVALGKDVGLAGFRPVFAEGARQFVDERQRGGMPFDRLYVVEHGHDLACRHRIAERRQHPNECAGDAGRHVVDRAPATEDNAVGGHVGRDPTQPRPGDGGGHERDQHQQCQPSPWRGDVQGPIEVLDPSQLFACLWHRCAPVPPTRRYTLVAVPARGFSVRETRSHRLPFT